MCAHWPLLGWNIRAIKLRLHLWLQEKRCYPSRWVDRVCVLGSTKEEAGLNGIDCLGGFGAVMMESRKCTKWLWSLWGAFCHRATLLLSFLEPCGELHVTTFPNFFFYNIFGTQWGTRVHFVQITSTFPSDRAPCGELDVTIFPSPVLLQYHV